MHLKNVRMTKMEGPKMGKPSQAKFTESGRGKVPYTAHYLAAFYLRGLSYGNDPMVKEATMDI